MASDRTDSELVLAVRAGDRDAFGELFERWFDRVHDVARNIVRSPETAADVAQDTFIAAWERIDRLDNPDAFGGWLLRIARNRSLDRLEREGRSRPQEHDVVTGLHDRGARDLTGSDRTLDPEEISASHDRDGLVRAATVALGERDASVLDLHLRHGLTPAEIADELGVTANHAHQLLFRMRKRLGDAIGAFVLFHRGRPACGDLATVLPVDAAFDAATFETIERHRRTCDDCTSRRDRLVSPEQLFSAAPVLVVPELLRSRVLQHLDAVGVPTPTGTPAAPASPSSTTPNPTPEPRIDPGAASMPPHDASAPLEASPGIDSAQPESAQHGLATTGSTAADGVEVAPDAERRSSRRGLAAVAVAAAVGIVVVLAIVTRSRDDADAGPASSLEAPAATSAPSTSAPTTSAPDRPEARAGVPPRTVADDLLAATTTDAPAADVAPTTAPPLATNPRPASPPPTAPPSSAAPPTLPPPIEPVTTPPPPPAPPPPAPPPDTTPPTTTPPTTVPPAPEVVRLFTPVALAPGTLICAAGSPHRFDWTTTGVGALTLVIGSTSRSVGALGPINACGSSGQTVTLTITGPGGTDTANAVVP